MQPSLYHRYCGLLEAVCLKKLCVHCHCVGSLRKSASVTATLSLSLLYLSYYSIMFIIALSDRNIPSASMNSLRQAASVIYSYINTGFPQLLEVSCLNSSLSGKLPQLCYPLSWFLYDPAGGIQKQELCEADVV